MKHEDLFKAIGEVDETLLEERKPGILHRRIWAELVAGIVLCGLTIGSAVWLLPNRNDPQVWVNSDVEESATARPGCLVEASAESDMGQTEKYKATEATSYSEDTPDIVVHDIHETDTAETDLKNREQGYPEYSLYVPVSGDPSVVPENMYTQEIFCIEIDPESGTVFVYCPETQPESYEVDAGEAISSSSPSETFVYIGQLEPVGDDLGYYVHLDEENPDSISFMMEKYKDTEDTPGADVSDVLYTIWGCDETFAIYEETVLQAYDVMRYPFSELSAEDVANISFTTMQYEEGTLQWNNFYYQDQIAEILPCLQQLPIVSYTDDAPPAEEGILELYLNNGDRYLWDLKQEYTINDIASTSTLDTCMELYTLLEKMTGTTIMNEADDVR